MKTVTSLRRVAAGMAVGAVALAGCSSGTDNAQVDSGPGGPIATTPPLTVPAEVADPAGASEGAAPFATLGPSSTVEPTESSEEPAEPTDESAAAGASTAEPESATVPPEPTVPPTAPRSEPAAPPATPVPQSGPAGDDGPVVSLGDFEVVNLVTGADQNIAELAPSGPAMLWFWAPHCTTCQYEAPTVVQFARDNPAITVVGVGAGVSSNGDSLEGAHAFVDRFGAAEAGMTMFYDVSFRSWRQYGVTTQPWVILFDRNGDLVYSQPGRVDLTGAAAVMGVS